MSFDEIEEQRELAAGVDDAERDDDDDPDPDRSLRDEEYVPFGDGGYERGSAKAWTLRNRP